MAENYEVLPGTPYSRYSVPIEYLPSRDFRPRWGETRPPIPQLYDWFCDHASDYRSFLDQMKESAQALRDVPLQFDPALLPMPAWGGRTIRPV